MPTTPRLQRRTLFSLAGASLFSRPGNVRLAAAAGTTGQASATILATPMHDQGPALNVAGPRDGDLAALARLLATPLAAGLMLGGQLNVRYGGGIDGVTGVNQFDARAAPDGREALLFPGSVAVGWLLGDRPVRFDCAHVLPLMAALGPGVLMVRGALPVPGAARAPLRLAGGIDQGGSLVALLGLDLLGIPAIRVARESEFAVLVPDLPDETDAVTIARRLSAVLSEPAEAPAGSRDSWPDFPALTASIGLAVCPRDALDQGSLTRAAGAALYRAKRAGGGCIVRPRGGRVAHRPVKDLGRT